MSERIYIEVSFRREGDEEPFERTGTWNRPGKEDENGNVIKTGADYLREVIERHYDGECDCMGVSDE